MKSFLQLATLLAALLSIGTAAHGPFSATLSTPLEQEMGEDVTCQVEITNNDDMTYYLLKRRTPLEGIKTHIFSIMKGKDSTLKYDGFIFKLGPPMDEEYIRIPGRSSVSSMVVLSKAYSFDTPSVYSVKLDTTLQYSKSLRGAPSSQHLSSNTAHLTLLSTGRHPKLTEPEVLRRQDEQKLRDIRSQYKGQEDYISPSFYGNWPSSDKTQATQAFGTAYDKTGRCISNIDSNPSLYRKWFGSNSSSRKNIVRGVYNQIEHDMETYTHILHYYGTYCTDSTFAYTWYLSVRIVLCKLYFSAPTSGYDSKFGVIIHEMSHSSKDTNDVEGAYGTAGAQNLANSDPSQAVDNADNYEYFAESL